MKNRYELMDISKGIAILAVIIGHLDVGSYKHILYTFHVPIFFIISGFFFKEYEFGIFLQKKEKGCIVPFLFFGGIIVTFKSALDCLSNKQFGLYDFAHYVFDIIIIQKRCTTLWFLTALFCGNVIFYVLKRVAKNDVMLFLEALCISSTFIMYDQYFKRPLLWNLDIGFIVQIYFVFGYCLKKYGLLDKLVKHKFNIWLALFMVILSLGFTWINYVLGFDRFEMFKSSYGFFPLTISASLLLSCAIFVMASHIHFKWLVVLGQRTITFFAIHQAIAIVIGRRIIEKNSYLSAMPIMVLNVFLFVIVMLICSAFDVIIRKSPLRVMIGA